MRRYLLLTVVALTTTAGLLISVAAIDAPPRDSEFVYARIRYHMTPEAIFVREVPWHHDYPYGDEAMLTVLKEVTGIHTRPDAYQIVDIDSPDLFKYPWTYLSEPGYLELNPKDVNNLRAYLDRGGFVMVDDFRGPWHLENLRREIHKLYPDRDLVPLTVKHPIFNSFYQIDSLEMRPPYGRGPVEFLGLEDKRGRLQMVVDYNNDLSEVWEWLDRGELPLHDAALSLKFGVDYIIYALTH
jgi:hypothetical protein